MIAKLWTKLQEIKFEKQRLLEEQKRLEKEKDQSLIQEKFTLFITPFLQRTTFFLEKEIREEIEEGYSSYVDQKYPFGELTFVVHEEAYFRCSHKITEEGYGHLSVEVDDDLDYTIKASVRFPKETSSRTLDFDQIEKLEEYSKIVRLGYSLAYYFSIRQIHIFKEQQDEEMVRYFTLKKEEYEKQLLNI